MRTCFEDVWEIEGLRIGLGIAVSYNMVGFLPIFFGNTVGSWDRIIEWFSTVAHP